MDSETRIKFRKELFELRMQQTLYRSEHKESSSDLDNQIKALKKEFTKELVNERKGELRK